MANCIQTNKDGYLVSSHAFGKQTPAQELCTKAMQTPQLFPDTVADELCAYSNSQTTQGQLPYSVSTSSITVGKAVVFI